MITLALLPLPVDSDLFKQALASSQNLDESELDQWDYDPPYVVQGPQETPREVRWTGLLQEVMHGRRLREQTEVDNERRRYYSGKPFSSLQDELEREIDKGWMDYDRIKEILRTYEGGSREEAMGRHLMQWKARKVYYAKKQLNIL
jgi:hypothetical protein